MKVDILGVKIDDINMSDALAIIEKWVISPKKHYIVTPNPEFIMAAQRDKAFKKILNDADLSIPDGAGLKLSGKVKNIVAGIDLMEKLVELSAENGFTLGFLGGREGVAKKAAECLKKKYPGLKVAFADSGGKVDKNGMEPILERLRKTQKARESDELENQTIQNSDTLILRHSDAPSYSESFRIPPLDILFVAFGHIKQEKWIVNNLGKIPVHVMIGVGGAFDYLSGQVLRAPAWIRNLGFEWLFRLVVQPWRIKRQLALLQYLWLLAKG